MKTFMVMNVLAVLAAVLLIPGVVIWLRLLKEDGVKRGLTGYTIPARTVRWLHGGAFFGPIEIEIHSRG